ncbi:lipocalin family protein [Sulfitobacter albidus]|uniref:Lipocalin family protein n=1 Tax=Sulfitobacter albidus TaxID=2829501 RepID=A0A975PLD0_9RHOB|nr:lipocalin family protein [Sulfitobacter albidus]QUJ75246.1 lipocalin family protein [Sulfitobacter albidus]
MRAPRVHTIVACFVLAALAACNAPVGSGVTTAPSYRDANVPIGVTSRFDAAKFAGLWRVRAVLPEADKFEQLAFRGGTFRIGADVCDPAGICFTAAEDLPTRRTGPGRYVITMPGGEQRRLWVLWVDEGFRTALVGSPDGTFAWILDRAATGGADRIRAAREILDFNGYDTTFLKEL